MYNKPIKIYAGVNNSIKIVCLNDDEKAVDASGFNTQLNIFEPQTQSQLISKTAMLVNPNIALGVSTVLISNSDLAGLDTGWYEIGLTATDANGNVTTLYVDNNFTSRLPLQLLASPNSNFNVPIMLTFSQTGNNTIISQSISTALAPAGDSTISIQANLVNYSGNVHIQGSTISPPTANSFVNLAVTNYSNYSGQVINSTTGTAMHWVAVLLDSTSNIAQIPYAILRY